VLNQWCLLVGFNTRHMCLYVGFNTWHTGMNFSTCQVTCSESQRVYGFIFCLLVVPWFILVEVRKRATAFFLLSEARCVLTDTQHRTAVHLLPVTTCNIGYHDFFLLKTWMWNFWMGSTAHGGDQTWNICISGQVFSVTLLSERDSVYSPLYSRRRRKR